MVTIEAEQHMCEAVQSPARSRAHAQNAMPPVIRRGAPPSNVAATAASLNADRDIAYGTTVNSFRFMWARTYELARRLAPEVEERAATRRRAGTKLHQYGEQARQPSAVAPTGGRRRRSLRSCNCSRDPLSGTRRAFAIGGNSSIA